MYHLKVKLLIEDRKLCIIEYIKIKNYASRCTRTQQVRQTEPSVKVSFFSPNTGGIECGLSGGTQRRALPRHQSKELKF